MIKTKYLLFFLFAVISLSQARPIEFFIMDANGTPHHVQRAFVDKTLRDIPADKLEKAMQYIDIHVVPMNDGEYALHANVRGLGGGPIGASVGATIGAGATIFVFNGFYGAVGVGATAVAGPIIGTAVAGTVRAFCLPAQVAATKIAALCCGIWLGVATGPL